MNSYLFTSSLTFSEHDAIWVSQRNQFSESADSSYSAGSDSPTNSKQDPSWPKECRTVPVPTDWHGGASCGGNEGAFWQVILIFHPLSLIGLPLCECCTQYIFSHQLWADAVCLRYMKPGVTQRHGITSILVLHFGKQGSGSFPVGYFMVFESFTAVFFSHK